jgi:hypothetical protein
VASPLEGVALVTGGGTWHRTRHCERLVAEWDASRRGFPHRERGDGRRAGDRRRSAGRGRELPIARRGIEPSEQERRMLVDEHSTR